MWHKGNGNLSNYLWHILQLVIFKAAKTVQLKTFACVEQYQKTLLHSTVSLIILGP